MQRDGMAKDPIAIHMLTPSTTASKGLIEYNRTCSKLNEHCGCDVTKCIIIISLILLAGLASAYTPEQQTTLDGMNLSFKLGIAYEKASQGQEVTEFNNLVDEYNAWVRQHFGEDAKLLMSKINEISPLAGYQNVRAPFNTSSDLSKFGKQMVYNQSSDGGNKQLIEEDLAQQTLRNF
jgi:hypothetical protein